MLQYKNLCLLLTTTQTSRRLCLLLEGCPKKIKKVVGESSRGLSHTVEKLNRHIGSGSTRTFFERDLTAGTQTQTRLIQ